MTPRVRTAVLLVVAAGAVVALTTTGVGLFLPALQLADFPALVLRVAGAGAAAAGLIILLRQRPRGRSVRDHGEDPTIASLAAAATIMAALALVALLGPRLVGREEAPADTTTGGTRLEVPRLPGSREPAPPTDLEFGMGALRAGEDTRPGVAPPPGREDESSPGWLRRAAAWLLIALLLAVAGFMILALRRRGGIPLNADDAAPIADADAEAGLTASLHELAYDGPDPRRQITAAYGRLLAALADAGAPRRMHEAPHEHLRRALAPLGVPAASMHRLAGLYVLAQFSERPITERHRSAAVASLEAALAALRSRRGAAEAVLP